VLSYDVKTAMKNAWVKFAAIFGFWTLLALLLASSNFLYRVSAGLPARYMAELRVDLLDYWIWAALTPAIFYMAKRFPFSRRNWARTTIIHFGAYLVFAWLHEAIAQLIGLPGPTVAGFHGSVLGLRVIASLYNDLWMYWPVVVIWSLVEYYQRYRERDTRAAQLNQQLTRAELQALRNQLHPHFLFNTLNSIAALMHEDVQAADDMLADLSQLLRVYLSENGEQEITLGQETELLRTYVGIQKRRFEDRLSAVFDIPAKLSQAAVPTLLLQPLVENAILYGIAPRPRPGNVRISAHEDGSKLVLEIGDDGGGLPSVYREGIGLSNTRSRLQQLYGEKQSFELRNAPDAGVTVRVTLPLRFIPNPMGNNLDEDSNSDSRRRSASPAADLVAAKIRP
jgi:two-component system, LytTR family, sensor kinase